MARVAKAKTSAKKFHVHIYSGSRHLVIFKLDITTFHIVFLLAMAFPRAVLQLSRRSIPLSRSLHSSSFRSAVAHPITAQGPPPKAPAAPEPKQSESTDVNSTSSAELPRSTPKLTDALKKRFWKDVHVYGKEGMIYCSSVIPVEARILGDRDRNRLMHFPFQMNTRFCWTSDL